MISKMFPFLIVKHKEYNRDTYNAGSGSARVSSITNPPTATSFYAGSNHLRTKKVSRYQSIAASKFTGLP